MGNNLFKGINAVYGKTSATPTPIQVYKMYINGKVVWEPGMFPSSGGRKPPRGGN